jgi:hypothetical protein
MTGTGNDRTGDGTSRGDDGSCGAHPDIGAELRALALVALDRLEPIVDRLRTEPSTAPSGTSCTGCPICAVLALLRGERPELAVAVAEQLGGLLAVLRTALEEGDPAAAPPTPAPPAPGAASGRRVQRIPVERVTS